jgi:hypothetical protein
MLAGWRVIKIAAAVAAMGAFGRVQRAAAQNSVELTIFAGGYFPTERKGSQGGNHDATRFGSIAWGGRLNFLPHHTIGFELVGGFSPARVSVQSGVNRYPRSTQLWVGAGKLVLDLIPRSKRIDLALNGGVAFLHSSKTLVDPNATADDVGGVAGATLRIRLADNVSLRGDAEDYMYNGNFGLGNKFTHDILLSGGLAFSF